MAAAPPVALLAPGWGRLGTSSAGCREPTDQSGWGLEKSCGAGGGTAANSQSSLSVFCQPLGEQERVRYRLHREAGHGMGAEGLVVPCPQG